MEAWRPNHGDMGIGDGGAAVEPRRYADRGRRRGRANCGEGLRPRGVASECYVGPAGVVPKRAAGWRPVQAHAATLRVGRRASSEGVTWGALFESWPPVRDTCPVIAVEDAVVSVIVAS